MKKKLIKDSSCLFFIVFIMINIFATVEATEEIKYIKIDELTLQEIQAGYANNEFTIEAITQAFLDRIGKYDQSYNAFTFLNPQTLDKARALDKRKRAGEKLGPLAGISIVVKDSIDVAGFPTTAGWAPLSRLSGGIELFPEFDAPVVERLRSADAIIIGKGNVPALHWSDTQANSSWAGPTYNGFDRRFIPGGSSTGVATAVSASFATLGLAEETGGSSQSPAAAQALVGVKPTYGLVPTTGVFPVMASLMDVVGPHTKTVREAAIMLDVIAGYSVADHKTVAAIGKIPPDGYTAGLNQSALQHKRVGLYGLGWSNQKLSPSTQDLYNTAINTIKGQGAIVVSDPFVKTKFARLLIQPSEFIQSINRLESMAFDLDQYLQNLGPTANIRSLKELIAKTGENPFSKGGYYGGAIWKSLDNIDDSSRSRKQELLNKMKIPPASANQIDLAVLSKQREMYLHLFNQIFEENNLDALIFPQAFKEIPMMKDQPLDPPIAHKFPSVTTPQINILGLPGVVVPSGDYKSGAPFSLIIVGRKWSEAKLLGMAYDYEQAMKRSKSKYSDY